MEERVCANKLGPLAELDAALAQHGVDLVDRLVAAVDQLRLTSGSSKSVQSRSAGMSSGE